MNNQDIVDNAPEGATHIDRFGDYQKLNKDGESYQWTEMIGGNFNWHPEKPIASGLRSLADIKRIAELEKERDARDLEQQVKGVERVLCENSLSLVKRERMVLKQIMKQLHEKAKALKEQGECE